MKKFFSLVAALLAVSLVSFGFIACSDDDDDDDGPSAVATYKATVEGYPYTLKMFSDKTWTNSVTAEGYTQTVFKGTYETKSGDWTNGSVEMTITHQNQSGSFVEYDGDDKTGTYTISEGKFTFATIEFTKQ